MRFVSGISTGRLIVAGEIGQKSARLGWRFGGVSPLLLFARSQAVPQVFLWFPLESGRVVVSARHGLVGQFGGATPLLLCPATIVLSVL